MSKGPRLSTIVAKYHDKFDLLRDGLERDLIPHLDMTNTADAQIRDLATEIVQCLKVRRIELSGYPPKSEREHP
jgi:hypothetical protein